MSFIYNDGGRALAGFKGTAGDCVVRAIAIAAQISYIDVYNTINKLGKLERRRTESRSSARSGSHRTTYGPYLESLGWKWQPTMFIGSGCKVHMRKDELPTGRIIALVSKHMVAIIDGTVYDTVDVTRGGNRCVYGYYKKA
jgi:hypothetical protein